MTTKKPAASCKVPTSKPPTKAQYEALRKKINAASQESDDVASVAAYPSSLPPPHKMPPYGGKCWQQAYKEAQAYQAAAKATAASNQAAYAYQVAWYATDSCLKGMSC